MDGTQVAYVSFLGGNAYNPATNIFIGCRSDLNSTRFYGGKLDEVRILNVPRSADWISTEYANQNNPGSYISLSAPITASVICSILPVQLLSFEANLLNDKVGVIKWTVMQESENLNYEIEKSRDGLSYEKFVTVTGKNSEYKVVSHEVYDENVQAGITYYRIKISEIDRPSYYTSIRAINNIEMNKVSVIPNPFSDYVIVRTQAKEMAGDSEIYIYSQLGQVLKRIKHNRKNMMMLELSELPVGIYYLEIKGYDTKRFKLIKN